MVQEAAQQVDVCRPVVQRRQELPLGPLPRRLDGEAAWGWARLA